MPNALNGDEASSGYEAFSILKYGIDRNGNKLPVFLVAWGSGQNALLTYLAIPFIMIFGLNVISIRLPMAIIGCISLIIMYLLLRKIGNKKIAIIGLAFFAICPWHIMKSRWGLESNLFPDLVLIFVYFLIKGIEDKNKIIYYLSFVILGFTSYTYGTSYYFLPVFLIPLLIILVKKEKISIKQAIISIAIVGIISLPIILYVIINTFGFEQINLPFMTIPKLKVNRYEEITSISISNFIESMKILLLQYDNLPWNAIKGIGTIYIFSSLFTIIGLIDSFRKNKMIEVKYSYIFNIWFVISIILTFICEPNINRLNIIMIPIIYYTIIGIYMCVKESKILATLIAILYLLSFGAFIWKYSNEDCTKYFTFESGLEEVTEYIEIQEDKEVYFLNNNKFRDYIFILYYSKYNTKDFVDTVKYENEEVEFRAVNEFGRYHFEEIEEFEQGKMYIVKKDKFEELNIEKEQYKITEFENYVVIE